MKELETKFILRGGRPRKALRRLLQELVWAGFRIHPKGTRLIGDVYYDTSDQRIMNAGWSLRSRRKGERRVITCKQLSTGASGWFERREIEQSALQEPTSLPNLTDGPVLELLSRYVPGQAKLTPLFRQTNRRTTYLLTHPDHPRGTVELVMDRVAVNGSHRAMDYVEFEAELKQGTDVLLADLTEVIDAQSGTVRSRCSKFQRGLFNRDFELVIGDRKRELMNPSASWTSLGTHYLDEQFDTLRAYAPYAYEGIHIEGVHQMRVATRRMRAALRAFGPVMPRQETRAMIEEAGWVCDVLGEVRDLDVQLEHVARYRRQLPARRRESLDAYERHLRIDHRRAHQCLIVALDSRRYARFLMAFAELGTELRNGLRAERRATLRDHPGSMPGSRPLTIADAASEYVPDQLKRIRKAGRRIDANSPDRELHRLRIRIKRLRYQLEILSGPYGKSLNRASKDLKRLQTKLGDHQDACVARSELTHYRDDHARGGREKHTFDWLIKLEDSRAEALKNRFRRDWQRFEKESRKLQKVF